MNEHFCYDCEHSWMNKTPEEGHCPECGHEEINSETVEVYEGE
jgi:rRNA maturation endonuclease Nob1